MCGRFVLLTDLSVIAETFNIEEVACDYKRRIPWSRHRSINFPFIALSCVPSFQMSGTLGTGSCQNTITWDSNP
ncbi:hypothetical protein SAMN04489760_1144 [Syntrophus gentianae]|uniref:Uncharacterized protein n=1 Tax=Syntrophus gentianae TaxID=43775 RepID=A0A1H7Y447_9BACT|nr:hypothetical protein SAMN04489760_1144 [Syntrophus gentianae]